MKYNNNNNSTSSLGNDGKMPTFTLYTSIDNDFDKVKERKAIDKCVCIPLYL